MKKGYWINKDTRTYLSRGYLQENETVEERIKSIADTAEKILKIDGFSHKFEDYMLRGWICLSSPIWSNFGRSSGLPISCNGVYISDDISDIIRKVAEVGQQTAKGAGTSAYFGALRERNAPISIGGVTNGPKSFMEMFETTTNIISQGSVRRGNMAAYLDVEHPDIEEFLESREEGDPIKKLSIGVCISDKWMNEMMGGDKNKIKVWTRIIKKRFESGYPYIFFTDTVNNNTCDVYKDKKMNIYASNLCAEISLPSNKDESFVCCLSAPNLYHYDDWKDTDLIEIITFFLDAVMEEYIQKTENIPFMESAHLFSKRHRAIGIGQLGYHSYLQSKSIPFESEKAREINVKISKLIQEQSYKASEKLAKILGEPEVLKGYGRRNTTLNSIAPTTSSSFILGQVSPSIEPLNSNYFIKDLAKGKFTYKNQDLRQVLKEKYNMDTQEVWHSILLHGGSVQHLSFMDEHDKNVFKTFKEIDQNEVIQQAADRQKYIDQSQSLNLMIDSKTPAKTSSIMHIEGWKKGIKTFYYQRSSNTAQELARETAQCQSCSL